MLPIDCKTEIIKRVREYNSYVKNKNKLKDHRGGCVTGFLLFGSCALVGFLIDSTLWKFYMIYLPICIFCAGYWCGLKAFEISISKKTKGIESYFETMGFRIDNCLFDKIKLINCNDKNEAFDPYDERNYKY